MFETLCAIFSGKRKPVVIPPARDPWEGSDGYYVASLRVHLDDIANRLSRGGCATRTRFNPQKRCAEFHTPAGEVLARVEAHGEMGCFPYKAIVTLSVLVPRAVKRLFAVSQFGGCRVIVKESQSLL